tara:strand:+ start:67 stop:747 length:681 start_codon:yes stop_codon:yes gene_type:complete
MQEHILIVEDEVEVAKSVANFLNKSGYCVSHLESGDLVEPFMAENNVDLVLLDVMLPGMDGMQVCQMLRAQSDVPIFMLTACSEDSQKLKGLELGADDYICKPFSAPELILRIKNFLNRFAKERPSPGLLLNSNEYNVCYLGQKIELTRSECELIGMLQRSPNQAFTREQILDGIYQDYRIVSDRTVDTHIKNLRKKLKTVSPEHDFIQAVYGVGYRYVELLQRNE